MLVKLENHKTVSIKAENGGKSLAHLLRDAGMPLDLRCSEKGTCGKCEVVLESGSFLIEKNQIDVLPGHPIIAKACRSAALKDDCVIMVPAKAMAARNWAPMASTTLRLAWSSAMIRLWPPLRWRIFQTRCRVG